MRESFRRATARLMACAFLVASTSCYDQTPPVTRPGAEIVAGPHTYLQSVTLKDGQSVTFDAPGARIVNGRVEGKVKEEPASVDLALVDRGVAVERTLNGWKTFGLTIGVLAAIALVGGAIIAATKQSCPFVYSWNGAEWVFDAEPYGGAVTKGLERADDVVLDHLVADGGAYRLLLTNEVLETQRTNVVSLRVVDHAAETRIVPDERGNLHALRDPKPPLSARLSTGRDLLPWLGASDERVFEPAPALGPDGSTRDEIVLTFPRPARPSTARLVANAGTSLSGSFMIREGLALRGRDLAAWYRDLDTRPGARADLEAWIAASGLWRLTFEVLEADGWTPRGSIVGTGPLVVKDRVVPLDLSRAVGAEVSIRIRPPRGFWALNAFALDDGPEPSFEVREAPLRSARGPDGSDRASALRSADDRYDVLPIGAEPVVLTFEAPPPRAGRARTVVLHAQGFYTLELPADGEPDRERLARIESDPDEAVRFLAGRWPVHLAQLAAGARR